MSGSRTKQLSIWTSQGALYFCAGAGRWPVAVGVVLVGRVLVVSFVAAATTVVSLSLPRKLSRWNCLGSILLLDGGSVLSTTIYCKVPCIQAADFRVPSRRVNKQ